ncbi:hypothetical protein CHOED_015 [Vibrio phage CHOED]|uniref:hypothetical protein n=1 Tax=Vibrio phage CHOED TaxID=1458716 RepID=UPI00042E7D3B|nr:hypothetical protein CHOED_015 [Vibrio phage CHOED]AHK11875.1 hypothetical protein CHOED_015 [Vibrio phage CHOED]
MNPESIFNGPIPGQSLTQDPATRGPWEMPPKFTTANKALDHLFKVVTSKKFIQAYDKLLGEDKRFYTDELAANMLSEGFINGLWTVDVMVLLVEPLIAMMVWAAAQLGRSPSFSTDTGYEDRTGFEEIMGALEANEIPEAPQEDQEIPQDVPQEAPQSPLTSNIPQSPLTGGM